MKERQVENGSVIYREGDAGDAVFILQEGEVEILRQAKGEEVRLAVLRQGAIFGEIGVLRNKPRSTTVRALSNTRMIVLPRDEFIAAFGGENSLALKLIRMLCLRLLKADEQLLETHQTTTNTEISKIGRIRLLPDSPAVKTQIGSKGIEVCHLPYQIGCHGAADRRASVTATELLLRAEDDFQADDSHLTISNQNGHLVACDMDSHLGTLVNDVRIAHFEPDVKAVLCFGSNSVQLGSVDSPYRFRIIVEPADGKRSGLIE